LKIAEERLAEIERRVRLLFRWANSGKEKNETELDALVSEFKETAAKVEQETASATIEVS